MNQIKPIAQAGIFAGIHVVFLLLSNILFLDLLLLIALPFASCLYSLKNKPIHTLLFVVATTLICLPIDVYKTLLYILPSIISGIAYGYMTKLHYKNTTVIFSLSFLFAILFLFSCSLISVLFQIDFIEVARQFFHFSDLVFDHYGLSFLYLIGLSQSVLTHIVMKEELTRMRIECDKEYQLSFILYLLIPLFLITSYALFYLHQLPYAILCMFIAITLLVPAVIDGIKRAKKYLYYVFICSGILLFVFLPLYKVMIVDSILLNLSIIFLPFYINSLANYYNIRQNVVK